MSQKVYPMASTPPSVIVFECRCDKTVLGESVTVVGSVPELGDWQLCRATQLITSASHYPTWTSCVFPITSVQPGDPIEFKFVIQRASPGCTTSGKAGSKHDCVIDNACVRWESSTNRVIKCPQGGRLTRVRGVFDAREISISISVFNVGSCDEGDVGSFDESMAVQGPLIQSPMNQSLPLEPPTMGNVSDDILSWGRAILTVVYPGVIEPFLGSDVDRPDVRAVSAEFINTVRNTVSLRERMQSVSEAIRKDISFLPLGAVFLRWVATNTLHCGEDNKHFRPNHVANASRAIIETIVSNLFATDSGAESNSHTPIGTSTSISPPLIAFFFRAVLPSLPAFSDRFTCQVPMTKIRDLAHRNDIPHELKQRIKHTLQNKLHRCAAPSDYLTAKKIEEDVWSGVNSGRVPHNFAVEFSSFVEELKEYFNAHSLKERLDCFGRSTGDSQIGNAVQRTIDDMNNLNDIVNTRAVSDGAYIKVKAHFLTIMKLRAVLWNSIIRCSTGITNEVRELLMVDVSIAQYLTSTANSLITIYEQSSSKSDIFVLIPIMLLHVAAGQVNPALFCNLAYDYESATQIGDNVDKQQLMIAIIERITKVISSLTDDISYMLATTSDLGTAMGLRNTATSDIMAESLIRESMLYPVSRITSLWAKVHGGESNSLTYVSLLKTQSNNKYIQTELTSSVLTEKKSEGARAFGALIKLPNLEDLAAVRREIDSYLTANDLFTDTPLAFYVEHLDGEEDVLVIGELLGTRPIAVVTPVDIPYLSHISLRCRQNHIPFMTRQAYPVVSDADKIVLWMDEEAFGFEADNNFDGVRRLSFTPSGGKRAHLLSLRSALNGSSATADQTAADSATATEISTTGFNTNASTGYLNSVRHGFNQLRTKILTPPRPVAASGDAESRDSNVGRETITVVKDAFMSTCGSKAYFCNDLRSGPPLFCIPFGNFERIVNDPVNSAVKLKLENFIIETLSQVDQEIEKLNAETKTTVSSGLFSSQLESISPNTLTSKLKSLVMELSLPTSSHELLKHHISMMLSDVDLKTTVARLIARSSSDREDSEEDMGAGRFESIQFNFDTESELLSCDGPTPCEECFWCASRRVYASCFNIHTFCHYTRMCILVQPVVLGSQIPLSAVRMRTEFNFRSLTDELGFSPFNDSPTAYPFVAHTISPFRPEASLIEVGIPNQTGYIALSLLDNGAPVPHSPSASSSYKGIVDVVVERSNNVVQTPFIPAVPNGLTGLARQLRDMLSDVNVWSTRGTDVEGVICGDAVCLVQIRSQTDSDSK